MVLGAVAALACSAAPASAAPACTTDAAQSAIEDATAFRAAIKATGEVGPGEKIFDVFDVSRLFCHDLTGDGRREMAAFLTCCDSEVSPTPFAIFRPRKSGWHITYHSTTFLVSSQKLVKRKIKLRHPVYKRTDMPCCPSSQARYQLRWRKNRFKLTRQ